MKEMPSFQEAKGTFQDFIVQQGSNSNIIWVFREDIVIRNEDIFIKTPVPNENEMIEVISKLILASNKAGLSSA
jgi:hypothetical protein